MVDDALNSWLQGDLPQDPIKDGTRTEQPEGPDGNPSTWWDNQDIADRQGRRRKAVWALAVLPWLLVAGFTLGRSRAAVPAVTPMSGQAGRETPAAAVTALPSPVPLPTPQAVFPDPAPSETSLDPTLGAIAALAVQDALTRTDATTGRARYVDLALPEAATWIGDVAIVRVAAVVLEGAQGRWDPPRRARYAVPIGTGQGTLTPLSSPWALPDPPQTTPATAALSPLEDHTRAEAIGRALTAAGYQDSNVRRLARHPAVTGVLHAEVNAIAPGETAPRNHTVWLRDDPVPTLLGTNADGHATADERRGSA